jgi:hypothetical protein
LVIPRLALTWGSRLYIDNWIQTIQYDNNIN